MSLISITSQNQIIPHEYIQIGPSSATTIADLARLILRISGKDNPIEFDISKPTGDRGRAANFNLAHEYLNWSPSVTLEDGLSTLIPWIDSQLSSELDK